MGAIGRELPYLCSCDSGSNHAVRFAQSLETALVAPDALRCELWWLAREETRILSQRRNSCTRPEVGLAR
jgi:L-asparaginase II